MGISEGIIEVIRSLAESLDFTIGKENKNIATFIKLKYKPDFIEDVAEVLKLLVISDYKKGPESDRDGFPGEIYVFGKKVSNLDIYIKIRLFEDEGMTYMTVISFHC